MDLPQAKVSWRVLWVDVDGHFVEPEGVIELLFILVSHETQHIVVLRLDSHDIDADRWGSFFRFRDEEVGIDVFEAHSDELLAFGEVFLVKVVFCQIDVQDVIVLLDVEDVCEARVVLFQPVLSFGDYCQADHRLDAVFFLGEVLLLF